MGAHQQSMIYRRFIVINSSDLVSHIDIVKYPIITDKATRLLANNQYSFIVNPKYDKPSIKAAVESLFNVISRRYNKFICRRKLTIIYIYQVYEYSSLQI